MATMLAIPGVQTEECQYAADPISHATMEHPPASLVCDVAHPAMCMDHSAIAT